MVRYCHPTAPGTRNRVSWVNLCHPTGPYIETRFLTSPGFPPPQGQETG
ncbi:hypothetical protein [Planktothricoides raciborskii]|uniref:Uncharacterized protein n=1 Tax=Planktothricoides raciborskii FACHB-1370 TaxID=2949576 RepID=A0ABR8E7L5_9CYAN|nr:hypothetical protein [Planktothricoides raciborskii]MBD2542824.1 hypothetical protein [Planktothricoides raciborskii FACHB-1370]MBD2581429.1 hypothetical protein [Planktothricoides raciborskii FACHB-1261]